MRIEFNVGSMPVVLERNWFWGGMKLLTPSGTAPLQNPFSPTTHFSTRLTRAWEQEVNGKRIRVEKTRPLWFAGIRPQRYAVFVDGEQIANREGY